MSKKPTLIVLVGLPGSGKSTFFKERFADTHVRINGDMLHTVTREDALLMTCLMTKQPAVIDKTNVTRKAREKYIQLGKFFGFEVHCYFMNVSVTECQQRNAKREKPVPAKAIWGMSKQLVEPLAFEEGFDSVFTTYREDEND